MDWPYLFLLFLFIDVTIINPGLSIISFMLLKLSFRGGRGELRNGF